MARAEFGAQIQLLKALAGTHDAAVQMTTRRSSAFLSSRLPCRKQEEPWVGPEAGLIRRDAPMELPPYLKTIGITVRIR